jgi:myo-inositol-1(or 4)-monophosphatase
VAVEDVASASTLAGVVYDPVRDEEFASDDVLPGSSCDALGHALVATGFGYESSVRRAQAEVVARLLPEVRDIRRAGSAALDLAWLAAGRLDGYFEVRRLDPPGVLVAPPAIAADLAALVG